MSKTFETHWEENAKSLLTFAYRLTNNRDEAHDLVQDTAIRCFRGFDSFREGNGKFKAWACQALYRIFLDKVRAKKRRPAIQDHPTYLNEDGEMSPIDFVSPQEDPLANLALSSFEDQLREVCGINDFDLLRMAHVEEMAYAEIAEILDIPVGTVRSRLHRAAQKARRLLKIDPRFSIAA